MKNTIYLFIFISLASYSQDYGNDIDAAKLCTSIQSNNFSSDRAADFALERILGVIGASKRFVLQPCDNINNAIATSFKGIRYILYDRDFMNSLDSGDNWGSLFILAHEVGHHINGHSLDILLLKSVESETLAERRKQELEADEFAGFILAKLGGSLQVAKRLITNISKNSDDSFSTHPKRSKRLTAVENGYNKANNNIKSTYSKKTDTSIAEEYFYKGIKRKKLGDYYGAIDDFTKAIAIKSDYGIAYINRAMLKSNLKDYYGAISDYTKVIQIKPFKEPLKVLIWAYSHRIQLKSDINDTFGALRDANDVITIIEKDGFENLNKEDVAYSSQYYNRGLLKAELKDHYEAIADFTKAIIIDNNNFLFFYARGNSKASLKDYYGAIADFSRSIEISPNNVDSFTNRGVARGQLRDKNGMCNDFNIAYRLGNKKLKSYLDFCNKR
jgi:tetratricopeptide (TPR) repeat protein